MAVFVIAIHYQGNRRMPDWLYKFGVLKVSVITCVHLGNNSVVSNQVGSYTDGTLYSTLNIKEYHTTLYVVFHPYGDVNYFVVKGCKI